MTKTLSKSWSELSPGKCFSNTCQWIAFAPRAVVCAFSVVLFISDIVKRFFSNCQICFSFRLFSFQKSFGKKGELFDCYIQRKCSHFLIAFLYKTHLVFLLLFKYKWFFLPYIKYGFYRNSIVKCWWTRFLTLFMVHLGNFNSEMLYVIIMCDGFTLKFHEATWYKQITNFAVIINLRFYKETPFTVIWNRHILKFMFNKGSWVERFSNNKVLFMPISPTPRWQHIKLRTVRNQTLRLWEVYLKHKEL